MLIVHLDASRGLAGDMFLAAMAHLGLDLVPLEKALRGAGLLDLRLSAQPETRQGVVGRMLTIASPRVQPLRRLPDILQLLDRLPLSRRVRDKSRAAFTRLAEVEAKVHGVEIGNVHFHEVGAVDTVVDVVGAFWALEVLEIEAVTCSPLPWFGGTVSMEHGELPLPAPATLALYKGKPVIETSATEELVTPTGALLADQLAERFVGSPSGRVLDCGTGYGSRPTGQGLRAILCDAPAPAIEVGEEELAVLETNLDHLTAEELGRAMEALMEAGALDVLWLPGLMKKGRPGGQLQVLCDPVDQDRLRGELFRHTLTLGVRESTRRRRTLPRQTADLPTPLGPMAAKAFNLEGRWLVRPEYESLLAISRQSGRSLPELRMWMLSSEPETPGPDQADPARPDDDGAGEDA